MHVTCKAKASPHRNLYALDLFPFIPMRTTTAIPNMCLHTFSYECISTAIVVSQTNRFNCFHLCLIKFSNCALSIM